ncbi:MAG: GNAT family N-acetyltransferase [Polyangia bacterium]
MSIQIRGARREDRPAILALAHTTLGEFDFTFGTGSASDVQLEGAPESFHPGVLYVAMSGDELVGMAGVYPLGEGLWELRKMFLRVASRGQGIGQQLLERCITFVRGKDGRTVVLDTAEAMDKAIALYERNGFVRDDTQQRASRCQRGYRLDL